MRPAAAEMPARPRPPSPATAGRSELRRERRALMRLREQKLRDLGGLSLEMYRRDRFREDLLLERCAELIGLEARIHELDVLLGTAEPRAGRPEDRALRVRRAAAVGLPLLRHAAGARSPTRRRTRDERRGTGPLPALQRDGAAGSGVLPRVRQPPRPRAGGPVARASTAVAERHDWAGAMARAGTARARDRRARHRRRDRDLRTTARSRRRSRPRRAAA